MQGSVGSCIRCNGPCGRVVWKGCAGERACGGTQKNLTCHTPLALRAGVAPSTLMWHPAPRASASCVRSPRRARPAGGDRGHISTAGGARTALLCCPPRRVHQPPPGSAGARLAAGAAGGGKGRLIFLYSRRAACAGVDQRHEPLHQRQGTDREIALHGSLSLPDRQWFPDNSRTEP
jgi:hypothetical protein